MMLAFDQVYYLGHGVLSNKERAMEPLPLI